MFNAISAIILFFHCKTKDIDCPAQCNNTDFHLFPLAFPGLYLCFSCLPTKYKTKCNTTFTVSWMMHQTSRSSCTQRTSYFAILLDKTQLCIKSWEYGLNQTMWNYYFSCLDKFQSLHKLLTVVKVFGSLYNCL